MDAATASATGKLARSLQMDAKARSWKGKASRYWALVALTHTTGRGRRNMSAKVAPLKTSRSSQSFRLLRSFSPPENNRTRLLGFSRLKRRPASPSRSSTLSRKPCRPSAPCSPK